MDWAVLVPELTTFHLYGLLWSTKNNKHKEEKKTDEGSFGTKTHKHGFIQYLV